MSISQHTQQIKDCGIIAILRGGFSVDEVLGIADSFISNGVTVLEITLNSPAALEALPQLQNRFGDSALIGAGTVRSTEGWRHAIGQGAAFTVAPNFDPTVAKLAQDNGALHIPGVATASEAVNAFEAGCRMQKLFPAEALGGVRYLKALRGPLDDVDFIPVGDVSIDNMAEYLNAGAVAVGMGSSLIPSKDWTSEKIATFSRTAQGIIREHRKS
jgi:2-dehydro-3-deoxyphosphogluconate aldolase / (4S)-4-hydroxy-2-oxoglutarate aldolase